MDIRVATAADIPTLERLINAAFVVERFFKVGDRINADGIRTEQAKGAFLLLERDRVAIGTVYVELRGDRGYIGMLSVHPQRQGGGYGRALMAAAEEYCRRNGAQHADLRIVNLREELPPFYRRLGYVESGTEPFAEPAQATQPCHFLLMTKPLAVREV
jgi:GNAT superfamily N-acetyltransferase